MKNLKSTVLISVGIMSLLTGSLTLPPAQVVSSTSMLKYEFDDAGLIIGYFQEFDTSRFANGKSLSFSAAAPSGIASSGAMMLIAGTVLGSLGLLHFFFFMSEKPGVV